MIASAAQRPPPAPASRASGLRAYVSLWSADVLALGRAVDLIAGHADGLHIDVFDGHDGSDLLFGPNLVAALKRRTPTLIDVHLMVADPDRWARRFVAAGADMITVQRRGCPDAHATVDTIHGLGALAGVALTADEPVAAVVPHLAGADRLLVMGTALGVKGVELDPRAPARIRALAAARHQRARRPEIVVDGGIRRNTVPALAAAGCDGVVPGSLVFDDPDPVAALDRIRSIRRAELEPTAPGVDGRPRRPASPPVGDRPHEES